MVTIANCGAAWRKLAGVNVFTGMWIGPHPLCSSEWRESAFSYTVYEQLDREAKVPRDVTLEKLMKDGVLRICEHARFLQVMQLFDD